jgi:hypothetical protein
VGRTSALAKNASQRTKNQKNHNPIKTKNGKPKFRVQSSEFRVQSSKFKVQSLFYQRKSEIFGLNSAYSFPEARIIPPG